MDGLSADACHAHDYFLQPARHGMFIVVTDVDAAGAKHLMLQLMAMSGQKVAAA